MTSTQFRVVVGPYRVARRYARRQFWAEDTVVIVTRAHQLAALNPAQIGSFVDVGAQQLGQRIYRDIMDEVHRIGALWPVSVRTAA